MKCMEAQAISSEKPFSASFERFLAMTATLQAAPAMTMQLSALEGLIEIDGREMLRTMLEEHIQLRGSGDIGPAVEGADGVTRSHKREREVGVKTIFGEILIDRMIYGKPGSASLAPKAAILNLPESSFSHEIARRLAHEAAKGAFSEATLAIAAQTGVTIQKRQGEEIAKAAAQDFEAFYEERSTASLRRAAKSNEVLVLTTDGKGVVMRKEDLRPATRKKALRALKKLKRRLAKGEKRNAKRMAQVASVYSVERHERTAENILTGSANKDARKPPRPTAKRVWASLQQEPEDVVSQMFDEAQRRDPRQRREWAILIDGQTYQLDLIRAELDERGISATVVLDIIHVIEYLWKAARHFYAEGDVRGEEWVNHYLAMVLDGKAKLAAAAMRRSATRQDKAGAKGVESCANYLHNNAERMCYDDYLARGLPIATGVIEGACRHLVKDRMDLTGARWSLEGGESVLKLRSIHASGDWNEYWAFHEAQEHERNHRSHYARPARLERPRLRVVK